VSGQFQARPLYSCGKIPRYPLDRRLGGPQNWGVENHFLPR
jgi:hypothetical protein